MAVEKNPAAVALGSIKTPKKAEASRQNGKKGGRPKTLKATEARKNMTVLEKHEQHVYDKDCYACEQDLARKNKNV